MIQRWQTVTLFLSITCIAILCYFPVFVLPEVLLKVTTHYFLITTAAIFTVLAVAAIFVFKNYKLQLRLINFSGITLLLFIAFAIRLALQQVPYNDLVNVLTWSTFLPLVSFIFLGVSIQLIKRDMRLIKSMDRLR